MAKCPKCENFLSEEDLFKGNCPKCFYLLTPDFVKENKEVLKKNPGNVPQQTREEPYYNKQISWTWTISILFASIFIIGIIFGITTGEGFVPILGMTLFIVAC